MGLQFTQDESYLKTRACRLRVDLKGLAKALDSLFRSTQSVQSSAHVVPSEGGLRISLRCFAATGERLLITAQSAQENPLVVPNIALYPCWPSSAVAEFDRPRH